MDEHALEKLVITTKEPKSRHIVIERRKYYGWCIQLGNYTEDFHLCEHEIKYHFGIVPEKLYILTVNK